MEGGYASIQSTLRWALSAIAASSDDFYAGLFSPLTSQTMGWGDQCETDRVEQNRGGVSSRTKL